MKLDVVLSPHFLTENYKDNTLCVIIDVLRATTTIITALAGGAAEVRPCLDASEARQKAKSLGRQVCLLGGEEKGKRIAGFDLGNSPLEYLASGKIRNKIIFFTTTNGTLAMQRAGAINCLPVYIAALLNMSAVSSRLVDKVLSNSFSRITLLCSGLYGWPSVEDTFGAGLMANEIKQRLLQSDTGTELNDGASIAIGFAGGNEQRALEILMSSEHGRYLQSIGFSADIEFASQIDSYDIIPVFDGERIVVNQSSG